MDNRKELERAELHKTIWNIANDLRGSVDGWDFKMYVLNTIFYRYLSEKLEKAIDENEHKAGNKEFSYAKINDWEAEPIKNSIVEDCGYYIAPSNLFKNIISYIGDDINEKLHNIFVGIEASTKGRKSEKAFEGLFADFDFTSNKLGGTVIEKTRKIKALLNGVNRMELSSVNDASIDAFGDAYEYLMSMYASNAGKSGGEFYIREYCYM